MLPLLLPLFLVLLLVLLLVFPLLAVAGGGGRGGAVRVRGGGVLQKLLQLLNPGEKGEMERERKRDREMG